MIASVMAFMTAFVMAFVTTFQLAWPTCVAVVKQRNSSGIYAFSVKRHGLAKSSLFSNAAAWHTKASIMSPWTLKMTEGYLGMQFRTTLNKLLDNSQLLIF